MKFFSYSPDVGFDLHETAEKAKAAAMESIAEYGDSVDGWDDDVEKVCWGELKQETVMINRRPAEPGEDCDFYCEYELADIDPPNVEGSPGGEAAPVRPVVGPLSDTEQSHV